jgi:hypothetical protein
VGRSPGLFEYLVAIELVAKNPVPRGLGGRTGRRGVPLVRSPRTLPKILNPGEVDALMAALRTWRARDRAALRHATCHELRHTCLTRLREAGMALEAVQAQAGHRSIETTRLYLHLANDWLRWRASPGDPGDRHGGSAMKTLPTTSSSKQTDVALIAGYAALGTSETASRQRRLIALRFTRVMAAWTPGICAKPSRPVRSSRRRDARPHRDATRGTPRAHHRRGRADRLSVLAPHPSRETPQRPLHPTPPQPERNSSTTGSPNAPQVCAATCCSVTAADQSHPNASTAPFNEPLTPPGSVTSTPTNSATPSPPKPSTGA